MAARGAQAKAEITKKILEVFPNSFTYDKEIRVPMMEDGSEVQVKITLTAAKTNVEHGGDTALPGAASDSFKWNETIQKMTEPEVQVATAPTEEEKANLQRLMATLF